MSIGQRISERMIDSLTPHIPWTRLLYRETRLNYTIAEIVGAYLRATSRTIYSWGNRFDSGKELGDGNIPETVAKEEPREGHICTYKKWPVELSWHASDRERSEYVLRTLAVGPSGKDIVQAAMAFHALNCQKRQFAIYNVDTDHDGLELIRSSPPSDRAGWYIVPTEAEVVRADVKFWLENQQWYHDRGMAWKLGIELEGPPGTGKSTLIKRMAQEFEVPLFVIEPEVLGVISSWDQLWELACLHTKPPIFVLIEDFDIALRPSAFEGLEQVRDPDEPPIGRPIQRNSRRTLSAIMNLMDGVATPDGVCFFVTTNHHDEIEEAAVRPGRIDRIVHIGVASDEVRLSLARRILIGFPEAEVLEQVQAGKGETAAAFRNRCRVLAVARALDPVT